MTKAGGQVTNLSVGSSRGQTPPEQESEQSHQTLYCTIQAFNGKILSPTVLGSGSAAGHPEALFLHVLRPRMQFRCWKRAKQTERAQCHSLLLPEIKNFSSSFPSPQMLLYPLQNPTEQSLPPFQTSLFNTLNTHIMLMIIW